MDWNQRSQFRTFASQWCGIGKGMRGINKLWAGGAAARHVAGSRRIYEVCLPNVTKDALVGVFPITDVAGGHTFFVQQLQTPTGRWPMAVHATYQFGDQVDYPFGKRQRFRDWGMWLADDDDEMVTGSNYLVLEDDDTTAPREAWVGYKDLHVRGRQHVEHLTHLRQRLAHGFALGRALNRTVVLPTLWCYCDKFWHRLSECAIPSATSAQPLPFVCPLDHVLDPSFLHGAYANRVARARRGMLAPRADGPWEEGLPYRGRYWLRQLGAHPRIGMSRATLTTVADQPIDSHRFPTVKQLLDGTRSASAETGPDAVRARAMLEHSFVPGTEGPSIRLPAGRTDRELRQALQPYEHVRLVHVSLSDAASLLKCYEARPAERAMDSLSRLVFPHEWCYRPLEMTAEWSAVERQGKPKRGTEPWCVWGFKTPKPPPVCDA